MRHDITDRQLRENCMPADVFWSHV